MLINDIEVAIDLETFKKYQRFAELRLKLIENN